MYRKLEKLELEKEYSLSRCIDDVQTYLDRYNESSEQAICWARETQSVLEDLAYGDSEAEKLDLYVPHIDSNKSQTLYVFLFTGYWQVGQKSNCAFAATNFQQHGDYFAVVNFQPIPESTLDDIVEQNRKAVAFLYQNADSFGYDPKRIVLIGGSGGAHLAAMVATTHWPKWRAEHQISQVLPKCLIKGVVAISGIYDINPLKEIKLNKVLKLSDKQIAENSPQFCRFKHACPFVIVYGSGDTKEYQRQAIAFSEHLAGQKINNQLLEVPGRHHYNIILDLLDPQSHLFQLTRGII